MKDRALDIKLKNLYAEKQLEFSLFEAEPESQDYDACRFLLNGKKIIYRTAKITPKKEGQFVTIWKRIDLGGPITPFHLHDEFDYLIIAISNGREAGQFTFDKEVLINHGLISSNNKTGKLGFRLYPPWSIPNSVTALKSQKWQLSYYGNIGLINRAII